MESEREVQRERGRKRERSIKYEKSMRLKESGKKDRQAEREEMKREWSGAWGLPGPLGHMEHLSCCSIQTTSHPFPSHPQSPAFVSIQGNRGKDRQEERGKTQQVCGGEQRRQVERKQKKEKRWRKKGKRFINKRWDEERTHIQD